MPRPTIYDGTNPHQHLDYLWFVSESAIRFCRMQRDILVKYRKLRGSFITTNGLFPSLDNHRMARECLDVYTYDSYPNFAYDVDADPKHDRNLKDRKWSRNLMEVRSICPALRHYGAAVRGGRLEQPYGGPGAQARPDDAVGHAEHCQRRGLRQLFPLAHGGVRHGDVLARPVGLRQPAQPEAGRAAADPRPGGGHPRGGWRGLCGAPGAFKGL